MEVHAPTRPCLDPSEAVIAEMVSGLNVQLGNPAVCDEPDHRSHPEKAE